VIAAGGVSTTPNQVHNVTAALRIDLDSKAMRKWLENMALFAMIEVTEVGTVTLGWSLNTRVLVKLP